MGKVRKGRRYGVISRKKWKGRGRISRFIGAYWWMVDWVERRVRWLGYDW
jgi:hypothetical protein